jgi:hypothetical protein
MVDHELLTSGPCLNDGNNLHANNCNPDDRHDDEQVWQEFIADLRADHQLYLDERKADREAFAALYIQLLTTFLPAFLAVFLVVLLSLSLSLRKEWQD